MVEVTTSQGIMWQTGITHEVIGRVVAMFWRVLKSSKVQVQKKLWRPLQLFVVSL